MARDPLLLFASLVILINWHINKGLSLTFMILKMILLFLLLAFREPTEAKPVYLRFFSSRLCQT